MTDEIDGADDFRTRAEMTRPCKEAHRVLPVYH